MSSAPLVIRPTTVLRIVDLGGEQELLHPERVTIKLADRVRVSPVDVGALAYSVRKKRGAQGVAVVLSSLVEGRREFLRAVFDDIFVSGQRDTSAETTFKYWETVMDWCDANGHRDVFLNPKSTRSAFQEYCDHLHHEILVTGRLKPHTCAHRQRAFRHQIEIVHPEDAAYITRGVVPIVAKREGREAPRESYVKSYVDVYIRIATQYSNFLMSGAPFPFVAKFNGFDAHVFPFAGATSTPYSKERVSKTLSADGSRVVAVEEYRKNYPGIKPAEARSQVAETHEAIKAANDDLRHDKRMAAASMAMGAYACLFSLITGAGASEFVQFEYDEALEIEQSLVKKELTAIKFRAAGKITSYPIGRGHGLQLLRNYFKFRAWLLGGKSFKYLFFAFKKSGNYSGEYDQLPAQFSSIFFKRIRGRFFPPGSLNIPPGSVRKFKSLILHELRTSPSLAASMLNHTVQTNTTSYLETTTDKQEFQFSLYWESVHAAADMVRERGTSTSVPTVVGHCDDMEQPIRLVDSPPIEPNCSTQYGCLYCKNFLFHADEEDLHKLFSLDYVISSVRDAAGDLNHAEQLFKDVAMRIDVLAEAVSKRSGKHASLVTKMKHRVNQLGILTPFWEKRLERYERLGVVF